MAENDIMRQTATHHERRRNRNSPRHDDSDGVNSHIPESTRRDNRPSHHDEENSRKERDTKMTKRTKRTKMTFGSFALLFAFSLQASAAAIENRAQRGDEVRAIIKAEVVERDGRFNNDTEIRFDEFATRTNARQATPFERNFNAVKFRAEKSNQNRFLNRPDFRSRIERVESQRTSREDIARNDRGQTRLDRQLANRLDAVRDQRNFAALRENRSGADVDFCNDGECGPENILNT